MYMSNPSEHPLIDRWLDEEEDDGFGVTDTMGASDEAIITVVKKALESGEEIGPEVGVIH